MGAARGSYQQIPGPSMMDRSTKDGPLTPCSDVKFVKGRRHRSGQVYRTRPLVKSHLCVALFAMHVPCREVQSSRQFSLGSECVQEINFNSRCKVSMYRKSIPTVGKFRTLSKAENESLSQK